MTTIWDSLHTGNIVLYKGRVAIIHRGKMMIGEQGGFGIFALTKSPLFPRYQDVNEIRSTHDCVFISYSHIDFTEKKLETARAIEGLRRRA